VLNELRDYHLPAAVHWWPPAPGWWLLAAVLLLAVVGTACWWLRRQQRRRALRSALAELDDIARQQPADFAARLSRLLRRYALVQFPRAQVAGLSGDAWLQFLDAHTDKPAFSTGPGRLLRDAPYRPASETTASDELLQLARAWLLHNAEARA
jgi:HAMP domain-containing protein